jgi:KUP system potassium uptake protein
LRAAKTGPSLGSLALASLGVVYGDIGTSPLYAFRVTVEAAGDGPITRDVILGVLSLILWALIIIVTMKYMLILLRANNRGEGGTFALMALARSAVEGRTRSLLLAIGIVGTSLFWGDMALTPAISVLSAVEGLKVVTPAFDAYVIPISVVKRDMHFYQAVQRHAAEHATRENLGVWTRHAFRIRFVRTYVHSKIPLAMRGRSID